MADATKKSQSHFETLNPGEKYWRDKYRWLLDSGYRLRTRYHPDWIPSWNTNPRLHYAACEDSIANHRIAICDAVKVDDNSTVILKRVSPAGDTEELEIVEYLAEEPRKSDPRNHSVPILEILQPADQPVEKILVMPLCRPWDSPEFETLGEAAGCIRQLLEGVLYLHENRIAHRDIKSDNFMMDTSLFTKPFHPLSYNRSLDAKHQVHASPSNFDPLINRIILSLSTYIA
ncbi:hypothetical protein EST38_g11206 [Candolleomyces aberdarensis]|uniref:Protein kinase domain-containing protein n=1 Tax=Candolleomyces aberdarensis TaxID=2316362 RepID=A0A4Q2D7T3_9AGAR|nr:hypothetical protein EST38_g11206 [Candolleomyces aberdarensis]